MMYYKCHEAMEIVPGLILGGVGDVDAMIQKGAEVLVPLAYLPGRVWDTGFRGEILYYPVEDYSVLPEDVLDKLVSDILNRMNDGKRVGLFCVGGHGRTGYAAACVLVRRGIENPVSYLHQHYCVKAVETEEQREAIIRFRERWKR